MIGQSDIWTYGLASDVRLEVSEDQAWLQSPEGSMRLADPSQVALARGLSQGNISEMALLERIKETVDPQDKCAAFLFRLDQSGFLCRYLMQGAQIVARCIPRRAPEVGFPPSLPKYPLVLSPSAVLQPWDGGVRVHVPGGWAHVDLLDKRLGPLLFELSRGCEQDLIEATGHAPLVMDALFRLFAWCGLLEGRADTDAPVHEALFHSQTRNGFARTKIGKTGGTAPAKAPKARPQIALPMPDRAALIANDAPHALVAQQRESRRAQSVDPISRAQLGELLFRCFYREDGRCPYPSGGGIYPLTAYIVVHRCDGIAPGLYAYDALHHGLNMIAENEAALKGLLGDAAAAAGCTALPQILLVLSADMVTMRAAYGDLAYSLVLKEVGAVFQCVQLAGEAMKLAVCPLGVGNAAEFAKVSGLDKFDAPSVGEMMVGLSA